MLYNTNICKKVKPLYMSYNLRNLLSYFLNQINKFMEKKHQYQGLTKQEVEESRRLHGENVLTPPQKASLWSQFLEKFEDPIFVYY